MKCDSCNLLSINGIVCHETGCRNANKKQPKKQEKFRVLRVRQLIPGGPALVFFYNKIPLSVQDTESAVEFIGRVAIEKDLQPGYFDVELYDSGRLIDSEILVN